MVEETDTGGGALVATMPPPTWVSSKGNPKKLTQQGAYESHRGGEGKGGEEEEERDERAAAAVRKWAQLKSAVGSHLLPRALAAPDGPTAPSPSPTMDASVPLWCHDEAPAPSPAPALLSLSAPALRLHLRAPLDSGNMLKVLRSLPPPRDQEGSLGQGVKSDGNWFGFGDPRRGISEDWGGPRNGGMSTGARWERDGDGAIEAGGMLDALRSLHSSSLFSSSPS